MEGLVTLIRAMDCMSVSIGVWLNIADGKSYGITHRLEDEHARPANQQEARHLRPDKGEKTVYRRGSLWTDLGGKEVRVADAGALVVWSRLPTAVRKDLGRGTPLGLALQKVGARRHTDPPNHCWKVDADGSARLVTRLTATLLVGGRPWARTREVLHQVIVEHREPSSEAVKPWIVWSRS
jgi:hypothetical protein